MCTCAVQWQRTARKCWACAASPPRRGPHSQAWTNSLDQENEDEEKKKRSVPDLDSASRPWSSLAVRAKAAVQVFTLISRTGPQAASTVAAHGRAAITMDAEVAGIESQLTELLDRATRDPAGEAWVAAVAAAVARVRECCVGVPGDAQLGRVAAPHHHDCRARSRRRRRRRRRRETKQTKFGDSLHVMPP